tara:strand:- start:1496 stop:2137 length:642 start_codon:yes stop_codon:yes gene_type:complete
MNKKKITIVDYKCGNMFSLERILREFNCIVKISDEFNEISNADKLILPGVGSFAMGMENLKLNKIDEAISNFLNKGNYLLGICLGMQLLVSESNEFGNHKGLNLINGKVKQLEKDKGLKIPHTGWNTVNFDLSNLTLDVPKKLLNKITNNSNFYFTHSFAAKTLDKKETWASSSYGKNKFSSIIGKENIIGCQFHPEKSGSVGQNLIENFLDI